MTVCTCAHGFPELVPESTDFSRWRSSHCGGMDVQAALETLRKAAEVKDSIKRSDINCAECEGTLELHSPNCRWPE